MSSNQSGLRIRDINRPNIIQNPIVASSPFLRGYQQRNMNNNNNNNMGVSGLRIGMEIVPKIQSPSLTISNGNSNNNNNNGFIDNDNPDNTMLFIQDLKKMLKQTDDLLKSNREKTGREYW